MDRGDFKKYPMVWLFKVSSNWCAAYKLQLRELYIFILLPCWYRASLVFPVRFTSSVNIWTQSKARVSRVPSCEEIPCNPCPGCSRQWPQEGPVTRRERTAGCLGSTAAGKTSDPPGESGTSLSALAWACTLPGVFQSFQLVWQVLNEAAELRWFVFGSDFQAGRLQIGVSKRSQACCTARL